MLGSKSAETNQFLDFSLFGTSALITAAKNIPDGVAKGQELAATAWRAGIPRENWDWDDQCHGREGVGQPVCSTDSLSSREHHLHRNTGVFGNPHFIVGC